MDETSLRMDILPDELLEIDISKRSYNQKPWTCNTVKHPLDSITRRTRCSKCHAKRKYYCYSCHIALDSTEAIVPRIRSLPLKVNVIKHQEERDGKSTGIHAKILCPASVTITTFPNDAIQRFRKEDTILIYPGSDAKSLKEVDVAGIKQVVFICSTWSQTKPILRHPHLSSLVKVKLDGNETTYWRHQKGKSQQYLATIEAICYFFREYEKVAGTDDTEVGKLLFFYDYFEHKIKQSAHS